MRFEFGTDLIIFRMPSCFPSFQEDDGGYGVLLFVKLLVWQHLAEACGCWDSQLFKGLTVINSGSCWVGCQSYI